MRYLTIDKLVQRKNGANIDEIMAAIEEQAEGRAGISRSTVYNDLKFMESNDGFKVEFRKRRVANKVRYFYEDPNFSIQNHPIGPLEKELLMESLSLFKRIKGLPQFEWVQEVIPRIYEGLKERDREERLLIQFDENSEAEGRSHINPILDAMREERSITLEYQRFGGEKRLYKDFSPWLLKEYNNRWFVFGLPSKERDSLFNPRLINLALDRIQGEVEIEPKKMEPCHIDFDEYFEHVVGVTVPANAKPELIYYSVSADTWPYIQTKPLHHSQTFIREPQTYIPATPIAKNDVLIRLKVIRNKELEMLINSYGGEIKEVFSESSEK